VRGLKSDLVLGGRQSRMQRPKSGPRVPTEGGGGGALWRERQRATAPGAGPRAPGAPPSVGRSGVIGLGRFQIPLNERRVVSLGMLGTEALAEAEEDGGVVARFLQPAQKINEMERSRLV